MKSKLLFALAAVVIALAAVVVVVFLMQNQPHPYPTPVRPDIVNGDITVSAGSYEYINFSLSNSAYVYPTLDGTFNVSDGQSIRVYVMDKANFTAWQSQSAAQMYYDSGVVNNGHVAANLPKKGDFVLVYDNTFSSAPKTVNTEVRGAYV
jgi:hypothetical protein